VFVGDSLITQIDGQRLAFFFFGALEEFVHLLFGKCCGQDAVLEAVVIENVRLTRRDDDAEAVVFHAPRSVLAAGSEQWGSAFVCVRVLRVLPLLARNVRVVTTNFLDFAPNLRSIAVCIYDAAIGTRMENVTPTGRWWRVTEPIEAPGSASSRGWE
jgi:hypothetical protein